MRYYTGIGSRKTPIEVLQVMENLGHYLARIGFTLRSGGADGADTAFEKGAKQYSPNMEIYLPWKGFNKNPSELFNIDPYAYELASSIHPVWDDLKPSVQNLHARNIHQVLGRDLKTPSEFVIAWTENGEMVGGTRTALILADELNIPIINLGGMKDYTVDLILKTIHNMVDLYESE